MIITMTVLKRLLILTTLTIKKYFGRHQMTNKHEHTKRFGGSRGTDNATSAPPIYQL